MSSTINSLARLADPTRRAKFLASLSLAELLELKYDWTFWAREKQLVPKELSDGTHSTWLIMAGRGFGKTRTGAETVRQQVEQGHARTIALVGATAADVRDIMVVGTEDAPGILGVFPPNRRPKYLPSRRLIRFSNGAVAKTYSAEKPGRLRGPQHDFAWADEIVAWEHARAQETWDNLQFGLRKGENPWAVVTTTPKPTKFIRNLVKDINTFITRGTTQENLANLAAKFIRQIHGKYAGTRLGRQELEGLLLEDVEGALWTYDLIEKNRMEAADVPDCWRVAVGVDPTVAGHDAIETGKTDECGIVVAGRGKLGDGKDHDFVRADYSLRAEPIKWAYEAVKAYHEWEADVIAAEANNGGEMVRETIHKVDPNVPVILLHASRGKYTRAEPHAIRADQGLVHHAGKFEELEDEMCTWQPNGRMASPNRLDAKVWALFALGQDDQPSVYV